MALVEHLIDELVLRGVLARMDDHLVSRRRGDEAEGLDRSTQAKPPTSQPARDQLTDHQAKALGMSASLPLAVTGR